MSNSKFTKRITNKQLIPANIIGVLISLTASLLFNSFHTIQDSNPLSDSYFLTPWGAVGGCGAGASIDWAGQGVSDGYVDFQIMPSFSNAPKSPGGSITETQTITLPITFSINLRPFTVGLTIPFKSVISSMGAGPIFSTDITSVTAGAISTTGFGDINFTVSKSFGAENQFSLTGGVSLPTGRFDIWQDIEGEPELVPPAGQIGSGVLFTNTGIGFTKESGWGSLFFGLNYSLGMLYKKGEKASWDENSQHHSVTEYSWANARSGLNAFRYRNDLNTIRADNLSLKAIVSTKQKDLHHSFHIKIGLPMNLNGSVSVWKYEEVTESQGPENWNEAQEYIKSLDDSAKSQGRIIAEVITDNQGSKAWKVFYEKKVFKNKMWPSLTLGYGMEIFNEITPFFWAIAVPIKFDFDDKTGIHGFTIQAGIKFSAF